MFVRVNVGLARYRLLIAETVYLKDLPLSTQGQNNLRGGADLEHVINPVPIWGTPDRVKI